MRTLAGLVPCWSLVVLTGCGAEVEVSSKPKTLDGETIASRANAQLEKQNPQLAHGDAHLRRREVQGGRDRRAARAPSCSTTAGWSASAPR